MKAKYTIVASILFIIAIIHYVLGATWVIKQWEHAAEVSLATRIAAMGLLGWGIVVLLIGKVRSPSRKQL